MVKKQFTDINGKPFNRNAMVAVLLIGTFAGALMQTSLGTAIPTLMRDFDITLATAQQATTWFMLANGIMMPVSAFLSTRIPTKVLYITAYLLLFIGMTITSLTPAQHDMWWMFLAGRIIAAIAVGISMPLMQVVMVNIFPAESRGTAMGLNGIVIGLALCLLQQELGIIKLGQAAGSFIIDAYPVRVEAGDILIVFITVLSIGFLAAWYPVHYLGKKWLTR